MLLVAIAMFILGAKECFILILLNIESLDNLTPNTKKGSKRLYTRMPFEIMISINDLSLRKLNFSPNGWNQNLPNDVLAFMKHLNLIRPILLLFVCIQI